MNILHVLTMTKIMKLKLNNRNYIKLISTWCPNNYTQYVNMVSECFQHKLLMNILQLFDVVCAKEMNLNCLSYNHCTFHCDDNKNDCNNNHDNDKDNKNYDDNNNDNDDNNSNK